MKAHDVRRLRVCGCCGGFEFKELMASIDGQPWHVSCVLDEGLNPDLIPAKVLALTPYKVLKDRNRLDWALARVSEAAQHDVRKLIADKNSLPGR